MQHGGRANRGSPSEGDSQPVELLDLVGSGATPAPEPTDSGQDSTELLGQAMTGGGSRWALSVAAVTVGVGVVIGLLVGLDRAAPETPPATTANANPAQLITTTVTTTSQAVRTVVTTAPPTTLPPGEFLLGEETNLWLFYGGDDPLQRIDLDTGAVSRFGVRAFPAAATGGELVFYIPDAGRIGVVPLAAPGQQPDIWKRGFMALGPAPGLLWTLDPDAELAHPAGIDAGYGEWELIETATSEIVARRPGDLYAPMELGRQAGGSVGGVMEIVRPGPDLTSRPDGIHRYTDDGYDLQIAGPAVLHASREGIALIGRCGGEAAEEACEFSWVVVSSGETIPDLPLPSAATVAVRLLGQGRWLYAVAASGESELIDLQTGARLRFDSGTLAAVSTDGRWLSIVDRQRIIVADLLTMEQVAVIEGFDRAGAPGRSNGALFVQKPLDE